MDRLIDMHAYLYMYTRVNLELTLATLLTFLVALSSGKYAFDGFIDHVRIWNEALSLYIYTYTCMHTYIYILVHLGLTQATLLTLRPVIVSQVRFRRR